MEPDAVSPTSVNAPRKSRLIQIILVAILIVATVLALYFHFQVRALTVDPAKLNAEKVATLVATVGKLIDLPQGELPSVATITDPAPLAGNPFFANAKAGDEVLLYTAASKAFLYDPVKNIIVEVATINLGK